MERAQRWRRWAGTGLLLLMGGLLAALVHWEPRLLPVRLIEVEGELHHHSSELLRQVIGERLRGGILTADLDALRAAAEDLAWVGEASMRRVWPDRLRVAVREHRPIARWNDDGLVTAEGVVFHPRTGLIPAGLPTLRGDDHRAPELAARYLRWGDELMLAGHIIETLALDSRGDWRIELITGVELRLGTLDVEQRLQRFIASAPQLEATGLLAVVDLRYSNGFAVTWAHSTDPRVQVNTDRRVRSGRRG